MLWSRKTTHSGDRSRVVGLDLTASRVRAACVGAGKVQTLVLDEPAEELVLFLDCDRRTPEVGRAGYTKCRSLPHAVCSNFLPALAQDRELKAGRHVFSAEAALELALAKVRGPVTAESEAVAMTLPSYLAPNQVAKVIVCATRAKLPLKGTATAPLALAAARAAAVLAAKAPAAAPASTDGVVPLRQPSGTTSSILIIDADEFALSATVIGFNREAVKVLASAAWPRAGVKVWKDKLLDAVADRCVRLCRRDPRDSADAEQALFEQLDDALDRAQAGQRVSLTVRTAHWYQDVVQQPDEFDGYCTALAHTSVEAIRELTANAGLPMPPRAVWFTHAAGRLPGLAKSIHQNTAAGAVVELLTPGAVAQAGAVLVPRWLSGELPRTHLDTVIALPAIAPQPSADVPKSGHRR